MPRIIDLKKAYDEKLKAYCENNGISYLSMQKLLSSENTKKLLKRNSIIQQDIDNEIDIALRNENQ